MSTRRPSVGYHILALATILMWGATFALSRFAHTWVPLPDDEITNN